MLRIASTTAVPITSALLALLAGGFGCGGTTTIPADPGGSGANVDAGGETSEVPVADAPAPDGATAPDAPKPEDPGPSVKIGCAGDDLLPVPENPAARGPWPVGAKTVQVAGYDIEIWYPAKPGSEAGKTKIRYDLRKQLPATEEKKISDKDNPWQDCDCYADLPIDDGHGKYPLVVFVHGTAAFRTQSAVHNTHWASRGFVVVSADHPGIRLRDTLSSGGGGGGGGAGRGDQAGDVRKFLPAFLSPGGDLAFLADRIDPARLAMSGHSAGGGAIAGFGDQASVLMPLASRGVNGGAKLVSTLIMGGQKDGVTRYNGQQQAYEAAAPTKRLVGISNAGHLAFSDLCAIGRDRGGLLKIARDSGVTIPPLVSFFIDSLARDGCQPEDLPPEDGWKIVNHATSAVLEETLLCSSVARAQLGKLATMPNVGEYKESLK